MSQLLQQIDKCKLLGINLPESANKRMRLAAKSIKALMAVTAQPGREWFSYP
ncbi:MAG: hypothetical protein AB1757_00270 [Acidobacteriota bacterium]